MPEYNLQSWAVVFEPLAKSVSQLEREFRLLHTPIIGRIEENRFLLDMRTIQDYELPELGESLVEFFGS